VEGRELTAMGAALAGTDKPFVITSGAALGLHGDISLESDVPDAESHPFPRVITQGDGSPACRPRGPRVRPAADDFGAWCG